MDNTEIKEHVKKASNIIEVVDGIVTNRLVNSQHASDEFKTNQRIFNAILNVMRAIDVLKYEL